ncbi:hypothetical protein JQ615_17870 [Bradyrhizobium jicamae]|uniref:Bacteriocin n=1 Tax=Bradyrhizobium jicamae TaxID=280332 RepID=A0ABS5FKG7_9BRAD|nr:hypothetical protein [Bradyrhizobium jicamae]MBR0797262.1 hypothetical protein [Bradyrhizobium jicamae]MBR0936141.1 hypothetical protein [Bradyrhizobium jicamae]
MTKLDMEYAARGNVDNAELDEKQLELVSGSGIGDLLHRLGFAAGCILGGGELSVHGDQLHCKV